MTKAIREAELWVWLQSRPAKAADLSRRGRVIEAVEIIDSVEANARELKALLAERAGVLE